MALALVACSSGAKNLPESLYGTWSGGNSDVHEIRFSNGGRVELNGGQCAGEYQLGAVDGNKGSVHSGYIQCGKIMDGYFTATVTVSGDSLVVEGNVINGSWRRGSGKASSGPASSGPAICPKSDGSSPRQTSFNAAPPTCIDTTHSYTAEIKTSMGTIDVALDQGVAPNTVNNFVFLARNHFYDGLTFHRVVPGFVVQGGDPQGTGAGGPGYELADELPKPGGYHLGSVAMANSGPDTNGSQFFIVSGDQGTQLEPKYSLFGQVTGGLDVVRRIDALGNHDDQSGKPREPITMTSVTIKQG